ncbi:MAG: acyl--CoA ligase [Candidatus Omnitrophica bacterium]|nr:acyl--CoA ligase [Candidatus Omnitrophota bacterium]
MSQKATETVIRSFHADFERICRDQAQQRAILDSKTGRVLTYGALFESVQHFCDFLWDAGVRPSDRVFSILPNSVEQLVAFLAALWCGIDFCPISPMSTREELRRFVRLCDGAVGLVPHKIDSGLAEDLRKASKRNSLIPMDTNGDLKNCVGSGRWQGASGSQNPVGRIILFTSGTTADPKAIVVNGDRLWSSAMAWVKFHDFLDSESRFYNMLPMSYLGGLFNLGLIPLASGGSVVISDAFSAASALKFWREVEEQGVNTLWLTPTVLRTLLHLHRPVNDGRIPWKKVKSAFLGMATSRQEEKERFESTFGIPVLENYALSETTFLTSEKLNDATLRVPCSMGSVLPWAEVRTQPSSSPEGPAEIQVKTPFLFEGYLKVDGKVHVPLTSDGWFATGDLGVLEGDLLILKGRSKDIVKKGGYLLVLRDIEEVAELHPEVSEAAAVGVEHDFYGESATLCVRLKNEKAEPRQVLNELKSLMSQKLAKYKWPTEMAVMSSFPRTESGKILKRHLVSNLNSREGILDSIQVR